MPFTGWPSITDAPARALWLGRSGYLEAAALQHALVAERLEGRIGDTFLFLEHPPVVTLGRAASGENVLAPPSLLAARGVETFETSRGGDVTFHGPGQLVGYGIVDLKRRGRDVAAYLRSLEDALIALLATYGLEARRHPAYTGVWLGEEKVAAIGVRVDRWITSHGFALNVSTDLSYFDLIVPCGIRGHGVTSLERATGEKHSLESVSVAAARALSDVFGLELTIETGNAPGLPDVLPERILGGVRRVE